jgi:hypothetical protein
MAIGTAHRLARWVSWLSGMLKLRRNEPVPLDIGVLIIGSLLWDEKRGTWRKHRLDGASAQAVMAPIRYGRLSASRGNTYTMVFSRLCGLGQGIAIRCTRRISTSADLYAESEALWKAEQLNAPAGRIASAWGCVTLLCNPQRNIPEDIVKAWGDRVRREPEYGRVSQMAAEGRLISSDGMLQIAWPRIAGTQTPVQLDLLLATANDPTLDGALLAYPTVQAIANAWNTANGKHAEYFWRNNENGINTFQDDGIRALLHPRVQRVRS